MKDNNIKTIEETHKAPDGCAFKTSNTGAFDSKNFITKTLLSIKNFYIKHFTIYKEIEQMMIQIDYIKAQMCMIRTELEEEIEMVTIDLNLYKNIVEIMAKELPDMFWLKDTTGKYIFANEEIKNKLLLNHNPIGQNDIQLANAAKAVYGPDNHTFGEKCANSDQIVTESMVKQRFMESGKIKGKMLYLEVYKAPLVVDGEFIGVFGSGRDMTEYVEAYIQQRELLKKLFPNLVAKFDNIFAKYSFESDIQ